MSVKYVVPVISNKPSGAETYIGEKSSIEIKTAILRLARARFNFMDGIRSNFTMIPNIVFETLTNDCDLVAYQKMVRFIGMGKEFKGGVRTLAAKLNISLGKVTKLRARLEEVGFIEVVKGDNAHGESDTWKILDIWHLNTCSRNDTGQDTNFEQALIDPPFCAPPVHETIQPRSQNDTGTCSRNDTHKENIFSKEGIQDLNISLSARASGIPVSDLVESEERSTHFVEISDGMKERLGTPAGLPREFEWRAVINFAFINGFSADRFLQTYDLLERIRKKKQGPWKVTPRMIEDNVADLERLEIELRNLENGTNTNQKRGNDNGGGYANQDSSAILADIRRTKRQPTRL